ncbi:TetR/AcrR family transcriptional regulator [Phytoactinopolyspora endophytica]|uniref:TetR/AcrR family transcriptional regulator n=1 Tax=Phytoactinopolyspora endophytica TaxID=1642495 RepID=UPI00101B7EB1|nr:TetR/AcrR family transcriptional regulator [Phytoactinopolyspora endophytica]
MTTTRVRKRADAERNIAAIIDAAHGLFMRGAAPSMSEIAIAAGVGRVTLYAHFPSRERVLEAVIDRALEDTTATLDALNLGSEPADVELEKAVRTSWKALDRHRRLREVALAELGPQQVDERHLSAAGWLEELIARGRRDNLFRTDLPQSWLVAMFFNTLHTGADEVNAGRLAAAEAPDVLGATVLSVLRRSS